MKIKYATYLLLLMFLSSCTDKFEDFNTDKKNPVAVAGESLFTNAVKELADQMSTPNVNWNIWELWAQYWTETTYTDEANYDIVNRGQPDQVFRWSYDYVLKDLKEAAMIISGYEALTDQEAKENQNKLNIIEIINVFVYQRLVDIFGMVPYSEALNINNVYPVYESGADIYDDILVRLDEAISNLDNSAGSFGSADLIYGGDVDAWIKFANTLKIKIGINLADVNSSKAQTVIESAYDKAFESRNDEALFPYLSASPNFNQIHAELVATGRKDFVAANTIIDFMSNVNDPRLNDFFDVNSIRPFKYETDAEGEKIDTEVTDKNMVLFYTASDGSDSSVFKEAPFTVLVENNVRTWLGGTYGASSPYGAHTQVSTEVTKPNFPGLVMTYSQQLFYLAEAAARGYSVGGTDEEYYNQGITESILWWGGEPSEATAYLARQEVNYATASGTWQKKIANQAWLAAYLNGFLGYTTWRRLDYPVLNITPDNSDIQEVTDIPVRFTFPVDEQTLNDANYAAAAEAIGGDIVTTKIFWDLYDANSE